MKKEIVWMLGSGGLTVAIVGLTIGLDRMDQLDIQLHDTYFVVNPFSILLPVFLTITAMVYLVRCILNGFSQIIPNIVLIGGTSMISLLAIVGIMGINQSSQGGWVVFPPLDATPQDMLKQYNPMNDFLRGYKDLLIYISVTWAIVAITTTVKTVTLRRKRGKHFG